MDETTAGQAGTATAPSGWRFLEFDDNTKPHAVQASLAEQLAADLAARGGAVKAERAIARFGMDRRGMAIMGRPGADFHFDGLEMGFAADCVGYFLALLREAPIRNFADGTTYVKLHSGWNCLVLAPAQRDQLVGLMEAALPFANEAARAFYAGIPSAEPNATVEEDL